MSVRNFGFSDPSGGVRAGDADIALVWLPFRQDGLEVEPLFDDPRVVAMAADHPLASRERLEVADLLHEPMVRVDAVDPIADAYWGLDAERGGPRPGSTTVTGMEDLLTAIRAGLAIETIPKSIADTLTGSDLAIREVDGLSPSTVALCRLAGGRDPLLEAFATAARAAVAMPDPSP